MHIHQIVIDNFKSFSEKTVIPFENGFTTVSGPNGSGKSNIIDSVLFCLGLSTSRTMRAEKLPDLINNLSKRKEAVVSIIFRKDAADLEKEAREKETARQGTDEGFSAPRATPDDRASDTALEEESSDTPVPDGSGELVQVTRRIRCNASGHVGTYYLNGRPTTLTEIHDYLSGFNVSPGTYNVMMQGDVAGIVNMSPLERRKIIDEIAGVAEFDRKIEQAQRELEATGDNIERNAILLGEIETRLAQLSAERDHALKYRALRDDKTRQEGLLLSARYLDLKHALAATHQNIADARKREAEAKSAIEEVISTLLQAHEEWQALSEQVKRKGEDQQLAVKKQIEGLKGHVARKEDAIRSIDEKTAENLRRVEQLRLEIRRMEDNAKDIDEEIRTFQHQMKELQALYNVEAGQAKKLESQFDALTGSTGELSVKRNETRERLAAEEDALASLNRQKLDLEAEIRREQYEMELRQRGGRESREKAEALTTRRDALNTQYQSMDLEKAAFEAQIRKFHTDIAQARTAANQAQSRVQELQREQIQLEARQRAYEEVNVSRSVDIILRSDLRGVHGTIAQLADVPQEYALAMEIALGGRIQNIVVDDDDVAAQGIRLLQECRGGRATFLPLNRIQGARNLPLTPRDPGIIDYAVHLIRYEAAYDDIFAYALGETLIVEDVNAARRLLRRYRMVSLDGSLMEKSGAMTGGSQPSRGKGGGSKVFGGGSQIEQELKALAERIEAAEVEKEQARKRLTALELRLESTQTEYGELMQRFSRLSAERDEVERQLVEIRLPEVEPVDSDGMIERIEALETRIALLDIEIVQRKETVAALQGELDAIESRIPSDSMDTLREQMKEVRFQMEYYDSQIRNAQTDIKSKEMEKNYQRVGVEDCNLRITQAEQNNREIVVNRQAAQEEIERTLIEIAVLEEQTTALDEELKKLQAERDASQVRLLELEKKKSAQERHIAQMAEQLQAFQTRKRELEPQLQRMAAELQTAGITPESIESASLPPAEEITREIARLTRKMESMEPVNMLAIEEYDRVGERRNELAGKIETLNQEKETLNEKIAGYHELKRTTFLKAFESVDQNFRAIFAELSDGMGELVLSNPESPFEGGLTIHAQPRGKKMLRIEGLSGGEKSLTSLAFVFAIQRYMPAPFYALDEVDQNLDGINAEKLAQMVYRESRRAQFIVVSLRKPMIERSERTIGVTQRQNGATRVTGIKHRNEGEETSAHASPTELPTGQSDTARIAAAS